MAFPVNLTTDTSVNTFKFKFIQQNALDANEMKCEI